MHKYNLKKYDKKHCQRKEIVVFFERECLSEDDPAAAYNVTAYQDE